MGGRSSEQFLYLTTTGRKSGSPREIEIWFVEHDGRFYVFAERGERADWVKNLRRSPRVRVRVGGPRAFPAEARVLDRARESALWDRVQRLAEAKYGWGAGLPVEITPVSP